MLYWSPPKKYPMLNLMLVSKLFYTKVYTIKLQDFFGVQRHVCLLLEKIFLSKYYLISKQNRYV